MSENKLEWLYNRLKLMSFGEIMHRILNILKSFSEKIQIKQKEKQIKLFRKFNNYYFDDLSHIIDYYSSNEDLMKKLFENAEKTLDHKISFFSLKDINLGQKINWHKDYSSDKVYPLKFYSDIDYRDSEAGNVKYVWELNRFQHLFPLSQAYTLGGDEKYADEIINQINNWINDNPYMRGINWTSSLEHSLRLISWSWGLFSLDKKNYQIGESVKEKISTSIYQQTEFIYNNLSSYSSANDHLIGEAMGLAFIGTFFDYEKDSEKWQKKGIKILFEELEKQVFEDGLDKEQAFGYHCFVLNMFLTTFIFLEKNNVTIPDKYWQKLEKMADCIMNFSDSSFNLPNFGDADDSFILKLDNSFDNELPVKTAARFLLNTSSIIFNRPDFKYLTKNIIDEKTLWIFDKNKISEYFNSSATMPLRQSLYLEQSGHVLLKDKNTDAFMDVGALGYLSIAAHAHSDALSFCLNYKNKEFLIDPGTFAYHTEQKQRNYFRGTSAHNTIEIDGQNQSQIGGNFMWLTKAEASVEKIIINEEFDYVRAYHNGYIQQSINVTHKREILFMKDKFILIIDRLKYNDKKPHKYSLHWHTGENCSTFLSPEFNLCKISNQEETVYLKTFSEVLSDQKIIKGSENPVMGWVSKKFDSKIPSESIETNFESSSSTIINSLIYFDDKLEFDYSEQKLKISDNAKIYDYDISNEIF